MLLAYERSAKNTWEKNRKSPTWEFIRYLKARVEFDYLEPEEALSDILHFVDLTEEEQLSIAKEWSKVEAPAGMGPLEWALKMALAHPLKNPPGPKLPTYITFVSIAAHLQVRRDKPILLPVNELARLLQTKPQTISTLRSLAKRYGLLKEVAPYLIEKRATECRFAVEKFPELKERQ